MKTKKSILIFISIIAIIFLGIFLAVKLLNKRDEYYITDYEQLYDVAVQYLIDNDDNQNKSKERYKIFIDYKGFGITQDKEYRYAYMWIYDESYYVSNDKIISDSGSSMPYKFTFKDNKVVKCEIPKDGSQYVSSIKYMFPNDIENKVINYQFSDDKLKNDVKKYYSDLEDTTIYFSIGEGYTFDGKIIETGNDYIVVEVLQKTGSFNKADKVRMKIDRPVNGINDFYVVGNSVRITFNGNIDTSNPMQIGADKIEFIG